MAVLRTSQFHPRQPGDPGDRPEPGGRNPFERDRDRILYSSAFRRLGGVTQVVLAQEGFHNRLTHSLKVAQVGQRIAQRFQRDFREALDRAGGLDWEVVEAAGLAHDLGHPPFGHVGERELNRKVRNCRQEHDSEVLLDGFEGNPQAFRIVTRLSVVIRSNFEGLNLTAATLNAIVKYPRARERAEDGDETPPKFGFYQTEREYFDWARQASGQKQEKRTLEAEIMDWADDIVYAIHDIEDFYRAGLMPFGRVANRKASDIAQFEAFVRHAWEKEPPTPQWERLLDTALEDVFFTNPLLSPYSGTTTNRATIRDFFSQLTGDFMQAVWLTPEGTWMIDPVARVKVSLLKELTRYYVVGNPGLATQQMGQQRIVGDLFDFYRAAWDRLFKKKDRVNLTDAALFPPIVREEIAEALRAGERDWAKGIRLIADGIASMTEEDAFRMRQRIGGFELGTVIDPILR